MPFTWRDNAELSSAGSIADVGSHAYDTIRWMLDTEAVRVLAHADVIRQNKTIVRSMQRIMDGCRSKAIRFIKGRAEVR